MPGSPALRHTATVPRRRLVRQMSCWRSSELPGIRLNRYALPRRKLESDSRVLRPSNLSQSSLLSLSRLTLCVAILASPVSVVGHTTADPRTDSLTNAMTGRLRCDEPEGSRQKGENLEHCKARYTALIVEL